MRRRNPLPTGSEIPSKPIDHRPGPGRRKPNALDAAATEARKQRRARALELRVEGRTPDEIAAELGISRTQARRDVARALATPPESVEQNRQILKRRHERELRRIDAAMAHLGNLLKRLDDEREKRNGKPMDVKSEKLRVECVQAAAKLSDSRAKHLAAIAKLTVPQKVELSGGLDNTNTMRIDFSLLTDEQLNAFLAGAPDSIARLADGHGRARAPSQDPLLLPARPRSAPLEVPGEGAEAAAAPAVVRAAYRAHH